MSSNRHSSLKHVLITAAGGAQAGSRVELDPEKAKHLRKVLRMEWEQPLLALDGAGRLWEGTLEQRGAGALVRLERVRRSEPEPLPLELVIALPKNATMDWVVEKAVECGVTKVTPVVSSRSVVKPAGGEEPKYLRRWQTIMDGALEQCERLWRPVVSAPIDWRSFVTAPRPAAHLRSFAFISELREEQALTEPAALNETWKQLQTARQSAVRVAIGPEGGFAPSEREELISAGFAPLSLGNAVLRVETAVVAALTLARFCRMISAS